MLQIIKELNIEVTKPNVIQALVAKQYDMNTRFLKVTLMDCGVPITIPFTNTIKVVINAERKDGQSKGFDGVVNEDNTVTVPLHSWMLELEGDVICDISVMDTDKKLTTTSFTLLVEKAAYGGDDITSDPQHDVLVELIEEVKNSGSSFANALKGTVSGTEVCMTDISPIPHNIGVKLSNADAKLYKSGKNLFNQALIPNFTSNGITLQYLPDENCFLINGMSTATTQKMCKIAIECEPNQKYAMSTNYISGSVMVPSGGSAASFFGFNDELNAVGSEKFYTNFSHGKTSKMLTVTKKYCNYFWIYVTKDVEFKDYKVRVQLEKNNTATDFEPYIEPTECVVNTDGTANVPSRYPSTRLFTDTEGVTIEAEYSRDTNKVIESLVSAIISLGGNV